MLLCLMAAGFLLSCSAPDTLPDGPVSGKPEEPEEYRQGFSPLDESQAEPTWKTQLVTSVKMPRAFAPCLHTDILEIPMRGFESGYSIRFISDSGVEYEAIIMTSTDEKVTFRLPPSIIPGDYHLLIAYGDKVQELGSRYVMCDIPTGTEGINVKGTVYIDGRPASHVVISDGYEFTVSDIDGKYRLISEKANGYVFAQSPSDAVAKVVKSIPQFFVHISKDVDVVDEADFVFDSCNHSTHRVIVVTDLHLSDYNMDADKLCTQYFMPDLNATLEATGCPCYIFTAGDQTTESRWNYGDLYDWREYIADWKRPIYHCMGNHDNNPDYVSSDFDSESTYKKVIGPNWYSLDIGKVHYIVMDDIVYDNSPAGARNYFVRFARHQLDYLKKDLLKVHPETPVVVFSHSPLLLAAGAGQSTPRFESYSDIYDFVDCFDGFEEVHFISGHTHVNHNVTIRHGFHEHNMAASSGSTWLCEQNTGTKAHICRDGVIGGYQIWDADGSKVSWVHKSLHKKVEDGQFHFVDLNLVPADDRGTDLRNMVLLNVYNWDDGWKIQVTEGGRPLEVTQVYRTDPIYKLAFPKQISSQTVPAATDHLFHIRASAADTDLDFEITDRFGNVYKGKMSRPYDFILKNYE